MNLNQRLRKRESSGCDTSPFVKLHLEVEKIRHPVRKFWYSDGNFDIFDKFRHSVQKIKFAGHNFFAVVENFVAWNQMQGAEQDCIQKERLNYGESKRTKQEPIGTAWSSLFILFILQTGNSIFRSYLHNLLCTNSPLNSKEHIHSTHKTSTSILKFMFQVDVRIDAFKSISNSDGLLDYRKFGDS